MSRRESLEPSYDDDDQARFVDEPASPRGTFERDRARVLHSSALRRLAAKTQVMSLDSGDFPRSRLTHSLECAQIGRELADALGADPDLVDAACLAHDLGHPPFGHNGESVLHEVAEICGGFEGNAQSFRVLTRLEAKVIDSGRSVGLNLSRATLDAATKYPWQRRDGLAKWGTYDDDAEIFHWMRSGAAGDRRCFEAQIMDWSDDVAYSVHDLEDGIHAGYVPVTAIGSPDVRRELAEVAAGYSDLPADALEEAGQRLWDLPIWLRGFDGTQGALAGLKTMTSALIGRLCSTAIRATREAVGERAVHRHQGELSVPAEQRAECAILKSVAARFVMSRSEALRAQAREREQLAELAEALHAKAPDGLEPWLREFWLSAKDDPARTRVVVDQIASLTDISALAMHRKLVR